MQIKRSATAHWEGSGKDGKGVLTSGSTVLNQTQYSFTTRFADGVGTNPEELVAAAHAGCFAMKLAFTLQGAGFTAESIEAQCVVTLDTDSGSISGSHLTVRVAAPGLKQAQFDELVRDAEQNCPVSKLFRAGITVAAALV